MSVATVILEQLGGSKFRAMTGAKEFVSDGNSLRFKLPSRFAKNGINVVRVTLMPTDEYDMEFGKLWGTKYTVVHRYTCVYCDQLQEIFKDVTGLDTRL